MYKTQEGIIRADDQERSARIKKGVRQGCNLYIEEAMLEIKEWFRSGIKNPR